jgi:diadenylate cyclase
MPLAKQTAALLDAARDIVRSLPADAVLLLTETDLDWDDVYDHLRGCRVLIAAENRQLTDKLRRNPDLDIIEIDPEPVPTRERMSLALLNAVNTEHLKPGAHVVVLYNGIAAPEDLPEPIDSISLIHLSEHLEQLTMHDLRALDTTIPLDTLRLIINLATEIGREGREGKAVGTILVVGDTRKVLSMSSPLNFNPFKGYSKEERDLKDRKTREAVKEFAMMDGAIIVDSDGIAVSACVSLNAEKKGTMLSKGFGTRHHAAAAISSKTNAIAVCVSQTSGTVRVYQNGKEVMHIEPLARPLVWQAPRLETVEEEHPPEENGEE